MRTLFLFLLLMGTWVAMAQPERKHARAGNEQYAKGKFADAEVEYKKALDVKNNMPEAIFNLGDAQYQQKRYEDAARQFQLMGTLDKTPIRRAQAYHNLGNALLEQKEYAKAIEAYKKALKIQPQDRDTKYNLALANARMKEQQKQNSGQKPQEQNQQNQDQQQQNQQQQGDQKQDQQKQNQDPKGGDSKEQQGKPNEQQQGKQPEKGKFSKEQAERLLQALGKEEEKTQQKMQLQKGEPVEIKIQKDW